MIIDFVVIYLRLETCGILWILFTRKQLVLLQSGSHVWFPWRNNLIPDVIERFSTVHVLIHDLLFTKTFNRWNTLKFSVSVSTSFHSKILAFSSTHLVLFSPRNVGMPRTCSNSCIAHHHVPSTLTSHWTEVVWLWRKTERSKVLSVTRMPL